MKRNLFIAVSLAAHFSVFWALRSAAMQAPKPKRPPIEMAIVEPKKLQPPPPPPDVPKPKVVKHVETTPPPPKPSNEPPPPPVFGLSLTSTAADSAFNMQVGNTTMTEQQKGPPPKRRADRCPGKRHGWQSAGEPHAAHEDAGKKSGECPPGNPPLYIPQRRVTAGSKVT